MHSKLKAIFDEINEFIVQLYATLQVDLKHFCWLDMTLKMVKALVLSFKRRHA